MAVKRVAPSGKTKKYTMYLNGGKIRRVTVPEEWRVTFGPLVPKPEERRYNGSTFALRFYESKEQQRACFTDVLSFYEEGIPLEYGKNTPEKSP